MTPELTITIIVIVIFFAVLLIIIKPLKNYFYRRFFRQSYYQNIKKLVNKKDYRLINNFYFKIDELTQAHFDHLIFGEKYIYAITDKYWKMGIFGKPQDESWLLYKTDKKRIYIDNPLQKNELRIEKLSLISGIDRDMFVTIVLTNNDCVCDETLVLNNKNVIIKQKNLTKLILKYENSSINKINEEQLQKVIYDLNSLKF